MPNRILKESICTSDSIDSLSWFEEVLFYRLIVNCDDYGRFDGRMSVIKNRLFPLKENITAHSVKKSIEKLATVGLVALYEYEGKPYLQLLAWENHQNVRAKKSKYPPFDTDLKSFASNCMQMNTDDCKCSRNPIQSNPNNESISVSISETESYSHTTTTPHAHSAPAHAREAPLYRDIYVYFKDCGIRNAPEEAEKFEAYNHVRGWDCLPDWQAAADLWISRMAEHNN